MDMKPYDPAINILVTTGGHAYDSSAFHKMLDETLLRDRGICWTGIEFPAAEELLKPEAAKKYDAILFFDMAGVDFKADGRVIQHDPPPGLMDNMETLLELGMPMLFLHHASGSWQKDPRWSEIVGGAYLVSPTKRGGKDVLESGFKSDVWHRVKPVVKHPITEGLEDGFDVEDEIFMQHVFEDSVTPVMRSSYAATRENFWSPIQFIAGKKPYNDPETWNPPEGSNLAVWMRREKNSPIVYIQPGHGPTIYGLPGYRRLIGNTVSWLVSDDAKRYGRGG